MESLEGSFCLKMYYCGPQYCCVGCSIFSYFELTSFLSCCRLRLLVPWHCVVRYIVLKTLLQFFNVLTPCVCTFLLFLSSFGTSTLGSRCTQSCFQFFGVFLIFDCFLSSSVFIVIHLTPTCFIQNSCTGKNTTTVATVAIVLAVIPRKRRFEVSFFW